MSTNPTCLPCRFPSRGHRRAALVPMAWRPVWRAAWWVAVSLGLAACAGLPTARMALPASLEAAAPKPFEGLGAGRSGRFTLDGQPVSFRRTGDALSVFDRLRLDRVSVEFEHPEAQGRCDGRATAVTAGIVDTPVQALQLGCRFTGRVAGELRLMEPRLAGAGTRQAREGRATFGGIVIDIRSEHALAGTPLPLSQPAGYRFIIQGRDVAALDLAGGKPVLRSAAGLEPALRAAVTQAALALGLLFDPALTLG